MYASFTWALSVLISGGSSPVRPSAFRSFAVNAVPLFSRGELRTAAPRDLVWYERHSSRRGLVTGARIGITLCRMLYHSLNGYRAARQFKAGRARNHKRTTESVWRQCEAQMR